MAEASTAIASKPLGLLAELNPHLAYNDLINKLLLDKPDLIRGRSE